MEACAVHGDLCWARLGSGVPGNLRSSIRKVSKYSGAKDEIYPTLGPLIDGVTGTYFDPFLGSGSIFLLLVRDGHLDGHAVLSDANPDVMDLHRNVRDRVGDLIERMVLLQKSYNEAASDEAREGLYYAVRSRFNLSKDLAGRASPERTAEFIFLLRAGYNGVVRYNAKREYNIAWAKRHQIEFFTSATPRDTFLATSLALQDAGVEIAVADFEESLRAVKEGDFVYLDPPYFNTMSATPGHYTPKGFPVEDQLRLKRVCDDLTARGIPFVEDNNDDPFIHDLYKGYDVHLTTATEKVTQDPTQRGKRTEVIVTNFTRLGEPPPPTPAQVTLEDYVETGP